MSTEHIEQETTQQKPWQKGFSLAHINAIKDNFACYNKFAFSPFAQWNGPKIADSLSKQRLVPINGAGYIDTHVAKTSTNIVMYYDVIIGKKLRGDRIINAIGVVDGGSTKIMIDAIKELASKDTTQSTWAYIWEEDESQRNVIEKAGFKKVGIKVTTFSEIYGVYFKDAVDATTARKHPYVDPAEQLSLVKLKTPELTKLCDKIAKKLDALDVEYANHYSKHNKGRAWSAISLRGFSQDPSFISKPVCMGEAWNKEHANESYALQDTEMRAVFPEVEEVVKLLGLGTQERIRFMRLAPGGGELTRHTDQVEPDAGVTDGTLMRIHLPIKTNPKVDFTVWDYRGQERTVNMTKGELWYLDIRKPHRAINGGNEERIHLVIDIGATNELKSLLPDEVE
jgi:hypothetical protein